MSMDLQNDMKTTGLLAFLRLASGGPELSLEFKKGEYSKPVVLTLDGHVVNAFLTIGPTRNTPNMRLEITEEPYGLTAEGDFAPLSRKPVEPLDPLPPAPPAPVVAAVTEAPPAPVAEPVKTEPVVEPAKTEPVVEPAKAEPAKAPKSEKK